MESAANIAKDGIQGRRIELNGKAVELVKLGDIGDVKKGIDTGENDYFLYQNPEARGNYRSIDSYRRFLLTETDLGKIINNEDLKSKAIEKGFHKSDSDPDFDSDLWFDGRYIIPYDKGGESDTEEGWLPQYYSPTDFYLDWSQDSVKELKRRTKRESGDHKATIRNKEYWFKPGITFSLVGQYTPTVRLNSKALFDNMGSSMFLNYFPVYFALGLLNSKLGKYLFKVYIDQTVAAQVDEFKEVPFYFTEDDSVVQNVRIIIQKQQQNHRYNYASNEQKEIDRVVGELYGLNEDDIREVELWYCRRYPKLAEAQGLLTEVKQKYAAHLERCKRILEKPPSYWRSNPILQLIAQGESHSLEFKEALEYDTRQNQRSDDILKSSLKTIAGFLNSDGGTLLIGVTDTGEIKGIERDLRLLPTAQRNYDRFKQKIRNCLRDRFTPSPIGKIAISFEELAEGAVCRVDVQKSNDIIHFDGDIYVRDGNKTQKLEGPALTNWIQQRAN